MSNWRKLNQLCTRITDGSHFSPVGTSSGYPMLSVKDMRGNGFSYDDCKFIGEEDYNSLVKSDCRPLLNDILIAKDGSYLKHVFVIEEERKEVILSSIGILRPNQKLVNPYYIKYFLHSDFVKKEVSKKYVSGSALPRIILKNFGEIQVPYIDKNRQDEIVNVLKCLDSKIELNNRINVELEAMAKTLYDYWFVQFDFPFDFALGKPDPNGKPYKTSGGKMVWNEELKREIPEGWEVKKMAEVLVIKNGRDHKHLELGSIPVYGSGGIMRYANESIYDSESILIPRKGTLGNLFYINMPFWCVDTIFYTIMKFSYSCKYLFYTIRAFNISSMNTGTAVPSMTTEILNNLALVFPPFETLKTFDSIISPIFQKKEYNVKENQQLSALRDWLLPMLMNGQVRVGDSVEKKVEYELEEEMRMAAEPEI